MKPLNSYLGAHRGRAGLTQSDVAHLVGVKTRETVARLENKPLPAPLRALLALELLFRARLTELFSGQAYAIRADLLRRAQALARAPVRGAQHKPVLRLRSAFLQLLAAGETAPETRGERVLSLDPYYLGVGFAVLETEPRQLVARGFRRCRKDDGSAVNVVQKLVALHRPTVLVVPDWRDAVPPHRRQALEKFIEAIGPTLTSPDLPVRTCSQDQLRSYFEPRGARTKHETALLLARDFPELAHSVPKKRQPWERERSIVSVFDALAMAVAVVYGKT